MKNIKLALAATTVLISIDANATNITSYLTLYNQVPLGGSFIILNNIEAKKLLGPIKLNNSVVTIEGINSSIGISNGNMSLNNPLMWIKNGTQLTLKNMTFSQMGGIFTEDMNTVKVNVDNVIFNNNVYSTSSSIRGNVLSIYGDLGYVTNSVFSNNSLTSTGGSAYGSAIYIQGNAGSIENVVFNNNAVKSNGSSSRNASGGAIYNVMAIDDNDAEILNTGVINISNSLFESNTATAIGMARSRGGAIYTGEGTVLNLTDTNFTNNIVSGSNTTQGYVAGGAIYANQATVNINAVNQNVLFSGNKVNNNLSDIYMTSGSTINLNASNGKIISFEGAIFSEGTSTINLLGSGTNLFNNTVSNFTMNVKGGVLQFGRPNNTDSRTYLSNVTLDFAGALNSTVLSSYKGLVGNVGDVQIKNADHIGLYLDVSQTASDSYNIIANSDGNFDLRGLNIVSDFTDDLAHNLSVFNGAFNKPQINSGGSFTVATNNYNYTAVGDGANGIIVTRIVAPMPSTNALDAAIRDISISSFSMTDNLEISDTLSSINPGKSSFTVYGNNKELSTTQTNVSAFHTGGKNLTLVGFDDIKGFHVEESVALDPRGAVVDNNGGILKVYNSTFTQNGVDTSLVGSTGNAFGGAIYNLGPQESLISGSIFDANYAKSGIGSKYALGGAIYNKASSGGSLSIEATKFIDNISSATAEETTKAFGGAIANDIDSVLTINNSEFSGNSALAQGGGGAFGGAIFNSDDGNITINNTLFNGNNASYNGSNHALGGAISNGNIGTAFISGGGLISVSNSLFSNNFVDAGALGVAYGGAIFNNKDINITDTSFINNSVSGNTALGGAIYNSGNLTLTATNQNIVFSDNKANNNANDIYNLGTLTFDGGMNTYLSEGITGTGNIVKNGTGALVLEGDNSFDTLSLNAGVLLLRNLTTFSANTVNLADNTVLSVMNSKMDNINLGDLTLAGTTTIAIDADIANQNIDRLSANSVSGGTIKISTINNLTSGVNNQSFSLAFADANIKDYITFVDTKMDLSAIYKPYDVAYNQLTGAFDFARGRGYNAVKPNIMAAPVALIAGNYTNQLNLYTQALEIDSQPDCVENSKTGVRECKAKVWFRSFADVEDIDLNKGPDSVDNNGYGMLIGIDSIGKSLANSWKEKHSVFVAYAGSKQKYDGVSINQNGGALGASVAVSKNDFWNKATIVVGASRAKSEGKYWNILNSGIALQSGYDIKSEYGVFQPNITTSYSYMKAFNYNSKGVEFDGGDINALQLKPGVKWVAPEYKGYKPYIQAAVVWSFMDKKAFTANQEALPELSLKPYVEYGGGVEKSFNDKWNSYINILGRNMSRDGVSFNLGVNMSF